MKKRFSNLFISLLLILALPVSALIHTPGDSYVGGIPGIDFSWGTYGALSLGSEWTPLRLDPLQWLTSIVGTEAIDESSNGLDADATADWATLTQKVVNTNFLDNTTFSTNGTTYDEKTEAQLLAHIDLDNNVVVVDDGINVSQVITWELSKEWTASQYTKLIDWLAAQGDTGSRLLPYEVLSGGIGPSNTWYTADGSHIYLVMP